MRTPSTPHTPILCRDCGKPATVKGVRPLKRPPLCNACRRKEWYRANPDKAKEINRKAYEKRKAAANAASRDYYVRNRERMLEQQRIRDLLRVDEKRNYNREYQKKNKGKLDGYYRAWRLASKYGISMADYERMHEEQGGVCAICKREQMQAARNGTKPLHVDHCHTTGKVRGLLCKECNTALGYVEKEGWLNAAQRYLSHAHHIKPPM